MKNGNTVMRGLLWPWKGPTIQIVTVNVIECQERSYRREDAVGILVDCPGEPSVSLFVNFLQSYTGNTAES